MEAEPNSLRFSYLPPEMQLEVLNNLELMSLPTVRLLGREWQLLADDRSLWKKIGREIDSPLTKEVISVTVKRDIFSIREKVKRTRHIPIDLLPIVHSPKTVADIKRLLKWLPIHDTVVSKKILAEEIGEAVLELKAFSTFAEWQKEADQFPEWTELHTNKLETIEALDLEKKDLSTLPQGFSKLQNLKFLKLEGNQLSIVPQVLFELTNLNALYLGQNQLKALPPVICKLAHLEILSLCGNHFGSLPQTVGNMSRLLHLDLSNNRLVTLPDAFCELVQLKTLYLHGNNFMLFPASLVKLTQLEKVKVNKKHLELLPKKLVLQLTARNGLTVSPIPGKYL